MSITAISEKCSICDEIEKAGYYAGFYCSNYYLTNYISESIRNRYSIWCTQYNDICICNGSYGMWQISTRNWFDNCNPEKIFLDRRNRQTNKKPLYWVSYLSGGAVFYNIKKNPPQKATDFNFCILVTDLRWIQSKNNFSFVSQKCKK